MTCPAGTTRTISAAGRVTFGAACAACPCGHAVPPRPEDASWWSALTTGYAASTGVRAADPGFQADYRQHRPMVERSVAWMTRGNRRLRYRGVVKNDVWWRLRAGAVDLKRLLNLGLTARDGGWAIA